MPESFYRNQKERAAKIINQGYQIALELGYLTSYRREGHIDVLVLNPAKYPVPSELPELKAPKSLPEKPA